MIIKLILGVLVVAAIAFLVFARRGNISGAEARKMVSNGARLVDVRSPEEFAAGHVEGSTNIPVGEVEKRIAELGAQDQPIIVYCQSGVRSARAARILKSAGYRNVHDLGAMRSW